MADKKISQLDPITEATTSDVLPVVNSGTTNKITVADLATSLSGSLSGITGSLLSTASVSSNTLTFTKGDGTTFDLTVDTGSGGGGSTFPYTGSAIISSSLEVTGSVTIQSQTGITVDGITSVYGTPASLLGGVINTYYPVTLYKDGTSVGTTRTPFSIVGKHSRSDIAIANNTDGAILFSSASNNSLWLGYGAQTSASIWVRDYLNVDGRISASNSITSSDLYINDWGSVSASLAAAGGGSSTDTGSLMLTGSVSLNTLTFTKGDGSTFNLTVDTGSSGGSAFPYNGNAVITGSLTVSGSASNVLNIHSYGGGIVGSYTTSGDNANYHLYNGGQTYMSLLSKGHHTGTPTFFILGADSSLAPVSDNSFVAVMYYNIDNTTVGGTIVKKKSTTTSEISFFSKVPSAGDYADITLVSASLIQVKRKLESNNDIEVTNSSYGVILKSPNGTRYRVTVDNSGNLTTTPV